MQTLTTYPITTLCSAPTVYRMLVQKDLKRYLGRTPLLNNKQKL